MTRRRQPNPSAGPRRGTRGKRTVNLAWVWATLGALGVLSAIGGYYVPGILESGGEVVTNRAPLDYDVAPGREGTPNFVFPTSSEPSSVPLDISRDRR